MDSQSFDKPHLDPLSKTNLTLDTFYLRQACSNGSKGINLNSCCISIDIFGELAISCGKLPGFCDKTGG
jgi:hypothetical protein